MATINASIAVILDDNDNKVYISKRQKHQTYSDYWEFPGGKVEKNETTKECIVREAYEEIGIIIKKCELFHTKQYFNNKNDKANLEFFLVSDFSGEPYSKEKQKLKLVSISKLSEYDFLPGSLDVVEMLQDRFS
ncbi:(deoxy)nucleoside triphosphate pyrophosphohydrolase [Francisella adeliensis]|uniref:8-oxo-dGTP diphosphatase n=1 Tax=Francisella adeliensis TaxID=2007306 RepID=A0A2Z4XYN8_9GAMM|nr:(deoxy)nucleoside triphosphate pyrophosphohydrolase [Francisella adeliensis]AXA33874.1 DNA mismatch repair protein MutT [Francisella adeliensis]MBK2085776.1 (deoxy)nucleoside triphosphate pyrophosphohydrolase [Francisella adeliensis]MBK2097654.1 (deoxy)nucleoside triphosphate pyrophosphohydrolase [Francisella adeliensis]QIW12111.1 (deoxy)nucleoside triphosphate pyrophosphohydrolase [Francisella adeliensis]QIW13985.1 (deoxy)nucleoside triphosphate pyrophosphohydrolase [Francisella adeliensis